jgi:hypothetical protein
MAKFHDEHRDQEHDDLVADIKKKIKEVAGLVYHEFDGTRDIKIEPERNDGECDYVIAIVSDYTKDTKHERPHLIIDARPKLELSDFEEVATGLEACQKRCYQETHPTDDPSKQVLEQFLYNHSRKVIVTRSDPDSLPRKSARERKIFLIVQDEVTRRFRLPYGVT